MTTADAANRFVLLRELFDLARAQREALEADSIARFEAILDERAVLIAQLQELADGGAALPENVLVFPGAHEPDADDELALDTLIRGILEHDRHNEALLAEMLGGIQDELQSLEAGRRVASKYATDAGPTFIDRTS